MIIGFNEFFFGFRSIFSIVLIKSGRIYSWSNVTKFYEIIPCVQHKNFFYSINELFLFGELFTSSNERTIFIQRIIYIFSKSFYILIKIILHALSDCFHSTKYLFSQWHVQKMKVKQRPWSRKFFSWSWKFNNKKSRSRIINLVLRTLCETASPKITDLLSKFSTWFPRPTRNFAREHFVLAKCSNSSY